MQEGWGMMGRNRLGRIFGEDVEDATNCKEASAARP